MKHIIQHFLSFVTRCLLGILRGFEILRHKILRILRTIDIYLSGEECLTLRDCALLVKLCERQPPGSDRFLEYPWMIEHIPQRTQHLLDVGSTIAPMLRDLLPQTINISAIDFSDRKQPCSAIQYVHGDIRQTSFHDTTFDCITCISTLEHIGVAGRYGCDNDPDGDLKAMVEMHRILQPNGTLLLTVPYGIRDVLPINKLYTEARLQALFENRFTVTSITYKKFSTKWKYWFSVSEQEAAKTDMLQDRWYAIALIELQRV
ncbi:class I SAM-dependent methyltransferase [Patescibacteria group bacterium]|nr:class I SAM-dependent methyltransferase [Patescibacteria group bacterium]